MTTLAELITVETKEQIYTRGLAVATTVGLPVTSWSAGDPTRADFHFISEIMELLETYVANYIASKFLTLIAAQADTDDARYKFLALEAVEGYGYTPTEATYATATILLINASGAEYVFEAGDLTVKVAGSETTYHNTSGGTLAPLGTLSLDIVCDTAGSYGTASIGDIDTMVTTYLDVTMSNTTAAVGLDKESAASIVANCRAKLGSLSPNGPTDAYDYAARVLSGAADITRTRTIDDSVTGFVTVYCAGAAGAASVADTALAEAAVLQYATPLCITPTVTAASNLSIPVTYELWLYDDTGDTQAEAEAKIEDAIDALFLDRPIGGDVIAPAITGKFRRSLIIAAIRSVYPESTIDVVVTAPAADVAMTINQVATRGALTVTGIHYEATP